MASSGRTKRIPAREKPGQEPNFTAGRRKLEATFSAKHVKLYKTSVDNPDKPGISRKGLSTV